MLEIEMLPAQDGDALWIRYGRPDDVHHVLIDCGRGKAAYDIVSERLATDPRLRFDLFVLTHIDADHIDGAVSLLGDSIFTPERVDDVWFNGWQHLLEKESSEKDDSLGALQGEYFAALLKNRGFPWNRQWKGRAVVVPAAGKLPECTLAGGMKLTLLSPTRERLTALRSTWQQELKDRMRPGNVREALKLLEEDYRYRAIDALGGVNIQKLLLADDFVEDTRAPNGSSIALLAEYDGQSLLLAGDAFPSVLESSLHRLGASNATPLKVDVFKLSHHGSAANTSPDLLDLISCRHALISTNGDRHSHPDAVTLARVVSKQKNLNLHFNYTSKLTTPWFDGLTQRDNGFKAVKPNQGDGWHQLKLK